MHIQPINSQHHQSFGTKFKFSKETIKAFESSTGLTYEEMTGLPLKECAKLMKERGTLKEPCKIKLWIAKKYKEFGERLGLLEKQYNLYTDID